MDPFRFIMKHLIEWKDSGSELESRHYESAIKEDGVYESVQHFFANYYNRILDLLLPLDPL
jgi:hypothetical protein